MAWVNGHHLGRFWCSQGMSRTMYVPGVWLRADGPNELLLLEHHALAENGGQGDIGAGCGGKEKREENGAIHGEGNDL
jgi:hypothetical protein